MKSDGNRSQFIDGKPEESENTSWGREKTTDRRPTSERRRRKRSSETSAVWEQVTGRTTEEITALERPDNAPSRLAAKPIYSWIIGVFIRVSPPGRAAAEAQLCWLTHRQISFINSLKLLHSKRRTSVKCLYVSPQPEIQHEITKRVITHLCSYSRTIHHCMPL